jgi:3-polyprenyl-4-hydroxybenzoate decarboxylase
MAATEEEQVSFLVKIGTYILGILVGLGAKLVVVNKEKPLTVREFVYHSAIAFASAWIVWAILAYNEQTAIANIVSVIVGRYGDIVLVAAYKRAKDFLNDLSPTKK